MTIDVLPDDVLLNVFDCYVSEAPEVEAWHLLVHVCRRWRSIVFGSPRRLDLEITCTNRTRVREMLDIWPPLPIFVEGNCGSTTCLDNIKAALKHNDRVRAIKLYVFCHLEEVFAALDEPFPALKSLNVRSFHDLPSGYPNPLRSLGQSSHLRTFLLGGISVPGLPKLLLPCTDLVSFVLSVNPRFGYISPEELFTTLSALTRLKRVLLHFESFRYSPSRRSLPPTRVVLPALTHFCFKGVTEYLEDVMSRIDAPLLHHLDITFDQLDITFDTPELLRFISRIPKWQTSNKANVGFGNHKVWIEFPLPTQISGDGNMLTLAFVSFIPDRHFPWVVRFCRPPFFPLPKLEYLYIDGGQYSELQLEELQRDDAETTGWLELFQPFSTVKNLYLSKVFAPRIAPTLEMLAGERTTEALPTLQNIFLEEGQRSGPVREGIQQVVAVREAAGHPIAVSYEEE